MTPREIIALTIGILVGLMFVPRAEPCRRGCCVSKDSDARRERWRRGEDVGDDAPIRTIPDGAEACPECGVARNGGVVGLHACWPS